MNTSEKKLVTVLIILTIIFTIIGGTLAYWKWQSSSEQNTAVTFTVASGFSCSADGGGSINNNSGTLAPAHCTNAAKTIKRTVTASVVKNGANNIFLDMYLHVNSIDAALAGTENFRYAFTTGSTSCDDGVVAQGNFMGAQAGTDKRLFKGKEYNATTNNDTYYLWIWLDYPETDSNLMNKNFSVSLAGTCTDSPDTYSCPIPQYDSTSSTPNAPVLDTGMIPVKISNNGLVTAVAANDPTWYNYSDKQWANAVLVKENGLRTRAENKVAGTNINQDDILAYFVWIPRYKYAIPESALTCGCIDNVNETDYPECYRYENNLTTEDKNALCSWFVSLGNSTNQSDCLSDLQQFIDYGIDISSAIDMYNEQNDPDIEVDVNISFVPDREIYTSTPIQINIIFESKNTAKSTGTAINNSYYTHPAFTFGNQELDGIWVGKFETSIDTSSTCYKSPSSTNCDNTNQSPRIVPNVKSLQFQSVSNGFQTALKFAGGSMTNNDVSFLGSTFYGLTANTDSHMMKNSEWGAVAYLSHSKYGINTEIRINNDYYITGCGALNVDNASVNNCEARYGNTYSYPQSTTGNISGIFDMSGGAWEYVMGHLSNNLSSLSNEYSDFSTMPPVEYYDLYDPSIFDGDGSTNIQKCTLTTCGGHALNETARWYGDSTSFVNSNNPWFIRGGHCTNGLLAGVFDASCANGSGRVNYSWRGVLVARGT